MASADRSWTGVMRMDNDVCAKLVDSFWQAYKNDFINALRLDAEQSMEDGSDLDNNLSEVRIQDS